MTASATHIHPPVAARETTRALARARRAVRRRKIVQTLVLAISLTLLGCGGFAYYQHTRLAHLDPTRAELSVVD